jgi:hypothetical protein
MSYQPRYDKGDFATICDSCGKKFKASELRKRWDGIMVCRRDYEQRQPQDFVRGVPDYQAPFFTRPEVSDCFIAVTGAFPSAIAGYAIAGYAISGNTSIPEATPPSTFTP